MADSKIVTAIGMSVNTGYGDEVNRLLERVMAAEVVLCVAEGATVERDSAAITARMQAVKRGCLVGLGLVEP